MIKCWNCQTELEEPLSSARKIDKHSHHMDLTIYQWEYVLNGLSALLDNAYVWGWADTEVETDIRNIIDLIEKNMGWE